MVQQTSSLPRIMRRVGLVLNVPKSQLAPTQRLTHISVEYWLDVGLNVPADGQGSKDRKRSVSTSIRASDDNVVLAVSPWTYELGNGCHRLGEIASQMPAALLARSLVPSIESSGDTDTSETQLTRSPPSPVVEQKVHPSRNVDGEAQTQLFTDASVSGWGAHSDTFQAGGEWSAREAILHMNQLEMQAVRNALAAFKTRLSGLTVQLMSDNATIVSYITKQGGTTSEPMYLLAKEVLLAARDANIFLRAKHIPGERNAPADRLSRMNRVVHTARGHYSNPWWMHSASLGTHPMWICVRLDSTTTYSRCFSPMTDPLAVEIDAMSNSWKGMYACIPPSLCSGLKIGGKNARSQLAPRYFFLGANSYN